MNLENNDNVVIMHCNHGKGRTGTIIVSLLLFANFFTHVDEAL
jgi:protein-tyrosine phosphatase